MRPNAAFHREGPEYLKALFSELRGLGRTKMDVCKRIGVPYRTMNDYTNKNCPTQAPYTVQFAIEAELAWERENHPVKESLAKGENRLYNGQ